MTTRPPVGESSQRPKIERDLLAKLVSCFCAINNYADCLDGVYPEHQPKTPKEIHDTWQWIHRWTEQIRDTLCSMQEDSLSISSSLRDRILAA